jgi:hypothetical protein
MSCGGLTSCSRSMANCRSRNPATRGLCLASTRNTPRWPPAQRRARRFRTVRPRPIHPVRAARPAQLLAQWPFSCVRGEGMIGGGRFLRSDRRWIWVPACQASSATVAGCRYSPSRGRPDQGLAPQGAIQSVLLGDAETTVHLDRRESAAEVCNDRAQFYLSGIRRLQ